VGKEDARRMNLRQLQIGIREKTMNEMGIKRIKKNQKVKRVKEKNIEERTALPSG